MPNPINTRLSHLVSASLADDLSKSHGEAIRNRLKSESLAKSILPTKPSHPDYLKHAIHHIASHDPSKNGSYRRWLVDRYSKGGINHLEDLYRAKQALTLFDKHKSKIHNRDIQSYHTLPQLEEAVHPFSPESGYQSNREADRAKRQHLIDTKQATIVHDSPEYEMVIPHTEEASKHFGCNTKWCTAAANSRNYFNNYKPHGTLYYTLHKPTNTRYAFFKPNKRVQKPEYFNERDEPLDTRKLVEDHPKVVDEYLKHLGNKTGFYDRVAFNRHSPEDVKKIDEWVKSSDLFDRSEAVRHGQMKHLDQLVNDPHWSVRHELAMKGHMRHLDQLVDDPDELVRAEVARHGHMHHLDQLVDDPDYAVRREVARHGHKHHLDQLVDDPNEFVRAKVASKSDDPETLRKLSRDISSIVSSSAKNRLKELMSK